MSTLQNSMNNLGRTANGALTLSTSANACVDFFFLAGASRGKDISGVFKAALDENAEVAVRTLLWLRDVREGAGERKLFRDLIKLLDQPTQAKLLDKIPEVGRWDDLLIFTGTSLQDAAFSRIQDALLDKNGLCAKWMPRKGETAAKLRKFLDLTPRSYRKQLVELSNTVEALMCANNWNVIDYSKIPSVAAARYQRAFGTHDPDGYAQYRESLEKGETKINAGAVYPYDVIKSLKQGYADVANAQWKALPNYLEGVDERILPMVDVSGSMGCSAGGSSVTCMDVAISLGMYLAERNVGIFKDEYLTFSGSPELCKLQGSTLKERVYNLSRANWDMNTDLMKAFREVLVAAKRFNVPQNEMPTKILILSDMEFDTATSSSSYSSYRRMGNVEQLNLEAIQAEYDAAGYDCPKIVFWNLNGRMGNMPASAGAKDVALVSGFSPSIMTSVLGGEDFTPTGVMLKAVMKDRYSF